MPNKPNSMAWGAFIRAQEKEQNREGLYAEYRKEYFKMRRYAIKNEDANIDIAKEAALVTLGDKRFSERARQATLGVRDAFDREVITTELRTKNFFEQHAGESYTIKERNANGQYKDEISAYNLVTISVDDIWSRYKNGYITLKQLEQYIEEIKVTPQYLTYGSP